MMRSMIYVAALIGSVAGTAFSQQPDSLAKRDSIQKAQTDSAMRADSIALERELGRIRNEPRARTLDAPAAEPAVQRPTNARMLPDISVVGDFVADLSPDGSTQEDGTRFGVREVELALQAAVDPYFRGDVFLGFSDAEGVALEQAYLTTTSLPWALEARLGRFLMPVGKQNTTHRHDLHTLEYSWAAQSFLGPEGLKGTGIWLSRVFSPFGFYQELQGAVVDALATDSHVAGAHTHGGEQELIANEPANKDLTGLGYALRLRNYVDLSEASNFELSGSIVTGRKAYAMTCENGGVTLPACPGGVNAANERATIAGVDVTYRWRPLAQGLYRSLIVQAEYFRQANPGTVIRVFEDGSRGVISSPPSGVNGAYIFARYQLTRRVYVGARADAIGSDLFGSEPVAAGASSAYGDFTAGSAYLEFFPSEFSKLVAAFERTMPLNEEATNRLLLQATFALGPHKPHPF